MSARALAILATWRAAFPALRPPLGPGRNDSRRVHAPASRGGPARDWWQRPGRVPISGRAECRPWRNPGTLRYECEPGVRQFEALLLPAPGRSRLQPTEIR